MPSRTLRWGRLAVVCAAVGCGARKGENKEVARAPATIIGLVPNVSAVGVAPTVRVTAATAVTSQSQFRLEIAALKLHVFYEYRELVEKAPVSAFTQPIAVLTNADVVSFATSHEGEILLQLADAAAARIADVARVDMHPYRVLIDGRQVLLGATYTEIGAAGLRFPVLHYRAAGSAIRDGVRDDSAVIRLFCNQGFACSTESVKRMPIDELRAVFAPK
jgi:hypothetical protein